MSEAFQDVEARLRASTFGLAKLKVEGETVWYDPEGVYQWQKRAKKPLWAVRATEFPRRKIARALLRVAYWICKDTDEGW